MPCRRPVDRSISCRWCSAPSRWRMTPPRRTARPCARSISAFRLRRPTWCTPRPMWRRTLGFFAKRCIEPNIIQFEGGQSATSAAAAAQGIGHRERRRRRHRPRPQGAAVLGPGAAHAAGLHGGAGHQDRGRPQGQEAQRDRRRRRRLQLAHGPRGAQDRRAHGRRRAIHLLRHRGPAAGPDRRPDRRRRAASRGRLSRQEAEADAQSPGAARRADAELHVQRLRRLARLDRRATARCCAMPSPR